MRLRRNSKPYQVLKYLLLAGGFLVLSSVAPSSGARLVTNLIKLYFRKKRFEREKFLRDLKSLQARDLVDYRESPNGDIKITLAKSGKKLELLYNLETIKLNTNKKWDGRWRMVIFDIPDHKNKARDAFRQKLKQLGFYPIQKSVYITPHGCEKEIDFICSVFNIREHILIFYVNNFEGEEKFRHYFRI